MPIVLFDGTTNWLHWPPCSLNNHHINITAGGGVGSNIEGDIDWQDENFKLPPSVGGALGVGGWSRSNMKGDIDLQRKKGDIDFQEKNLEFPLHLFHPTYSYRNAASSTFDIQFWWRTMDRKFDSELTFEVFDKWIGFWIYLGF